MLVLEANHIEKSYGDRVLFRIDALKVYAEDKIGVVGLNGSGKTTLLEVLAGIRPPDRGNITRYGKINYVPQLDCNSLGDLERPVAAEFGVVGINRETMSGGEKTRLKIAKAFSSGCHILIADEPTCNLDMKGIKLLEEKLKAFDGSVIIVSHDRSLLDAVCTKILEVEKGVVREYSGNYSHYKMQKEMEEERKWLEYQQYIKEKARLLSAVAEVKQKAKSMKKTPKRMGNSEARLHKREGGERRAKVEKRAKIIESRIENLVEKEKPTSVEKVCFNMPDYLRLECKVAVMGRDVKKSFGAKTLFRGLNFDIYTGTKIALVGDNGCGKSTLIRMILNREDGITVAQGVKFGYFDQNLEQLDDNKSILDNVTENSIYPPSFVRTLLARFLFKREDVYKKICVLSGGERVKVSLARILVSDANVLILDEPTNYLDIYSIEALEKLLKDYDGTVLMVSHDKNFINNIANQVIVFEDGKVHEYKGNYSDYLHHKEIQGRCRREIREEIMQLELRLSDILGRICQSPKGEELENLNRMYDETLVRLRQLKDSL